MTDDEWLTRRRAVLAARKQPGAFSPNAPGMNERQHGIAGYKRGCRCDDCCASMRASRAKDSARIRARKEAMK